MVYSKKFLSTQIFSVLFVISFYENCERRVVTIPLTFRFSFSQHSRAIIGRALDCSLCLQTSLRPKGQHDRLQNRRSSTPGASSSTKSMNLVLGHTPNRSTNKTIFFFDKTMTSGIVVNLHC